MLALLALVLVQAGFQPGFAQTSAPTAPVENEQAPSGTPATPVSNGPDIADQLRAALAPLQEELNAIREKLNQPSLTEEELIAARDAALRVRGDALQRVLRLQPQLSDVNARLDRLPPLPAEGQPPEPPEIAAERQALSDLKTRATLVVRDAELMTVQANSVVTRTLEMRRNLFVSSLLKRQPLDAARFTDVVNETPAAITTVTVTIGTWLWSLVQFRLPSLFIVLGVSGAIGGGLVWLRFVLRRRFDASDSTTPLPPLQRVLHAFLSTVLTGAVFGLFLLALHALAEQYGLYRFRIDQVVPALYWVLAGIFFVSLLLRAILAPRHPNRRLLDIPNAPAARLFILGLSMAVVYGVDAYLTELISIFGFSVNLTIVKTLLSTLLIAALLVAMVTTRLYAPVAGEPAGGSASTDGTAIAPVKPALRGWNPFLYWLIWIIVVAIVLMAVTGYVSLARFVAGQIVITGTIIATMYIGYQAARALAAQGAVASTSYGKRMLENGRTPLGLDQIGLVLSIVMNVAVTLIGVPLILQQWGSRADEMASVAFSALSGFTVGGVEISLGRILLAIGVFVGFIALTRLFQRWFDGKVLARTKLDAGVKNSVRAGLGYLGYFIAALIAISWAGFNLSNIAIIAGALSVGIGFGLQNIVNNFVSGLIMLIERPIKSGDIIQVGGTEGFVRKINVRATELETFDRQSVIIPNSEVINTAVANWMHVDRIRRVIIRIGVAYGSDVEKVREVLLCVLEDDDRVATHPAPFVYFADFGASSLDFELRFFIRDLMEVISVETDVRFRIEKAFREAQIEVPFPQQDIHIRSGLPDPKT
ncbi:MAG: mechanosensitive ion channel domain-containing protein [Pseudomonadota bacterium]